MRPAPRRLARAATVAAIVATLVVAALPALPVLASRPIRVTGTDIDTAVDGQRIVSLPAGVSHVALAWKAGTPAPHVSIAFGDSPSTLGEEVEVGELDVDASPDDIDMTARARAAAHATTSSGVLWTGGTRFARITTDRALGHVTVTAIDAQADIGFVDVPIHVAKAATTEPDIVTREEWGADESYRFDAGGHEVWPPDFAPMQKAIVHHTAGRNNDPNPAATVRAIYFLKAVESDFGDIGYNFLIDEDGRIYEGRHSRDYGPGENHNGEDLAGNVVRGGHARDFNDGTVGIALLGNFQQHQPTPAARNALERLLAWKLERHGLDPQGASTYHNPVLGNTKFLENISGHRNVNTTACPGDAFYPRFDQLREDVADRIDDTTGSGHDDTPPRIVSFEPLTPPTTGAPTIPFGLVFEEPVEGLEADDFDVGGSSGGWSVTDVSGGPSAYTIEVSADDPDDGSVDLTLEADAITDLAGRTGPSDDETATVGYADDDDGPTVELYQTPHTTYVNSDNVDHVDVTATFSEPVTGFTRGDVTIGGSSDAADPWDVPFIFGTGASYGFSLLNDSWRDGTLTFRIEAGAVQDLAGNPVQASNTISMVFDRRDPATTKPKVTLRSDTTLAGNDLRVSVGWDGDDAGPAGIDSYDVRRSVDGKRFKSFQSNVAEDWVQASLDPGHRYRFQVRATDRAGNVGPWKAGPSFKARLVQQNDDVTFRGDSVRTEFASYSGGSQRYLAEGGASAKLTTRARSLSFITTRGPNRGAVQVYVDGNLAATIDLQATDHTYRFVAFSRSWSDVGTHTIKVVAVGTDPPRIDVDAFGVLR